MLNIVLNIFKKVKTPLVTHFFPINTCKHLFIENS